MFSIPVAIVLLPVTIALSLIILRLGFPNTSLVEAAKAIADVIRAIVSRR